MDDKPEAGGASAVPATEPRPGRAERLEQELAERKAPMDVLFESSYDGLAILDRDQVFLAMNAAFERITGLKCSEWVGRKREEMARVPGVTRQSSVDKLLQGVSPATTLVNIGGGEMMLVTANPHHGPDGELLHIILNVRNITQLNYLKYQLERGRVQTHVAELEKFRAGVLLSRLRAVGLDDAVVSSSIMMRVLSTAEQIADFDSTVLLSGETGVGKGIVAKFIHRLSRRADRPFVEVNCGAIPEGLVESELFGYHAGAFTGSARTGKKGQFELAESGTVFLDEVSELPLASQSKLLKFLDDKVVHRLGGTSPKRVDVRVLAATNKNLREQVDAGKFRSDLLYRLEVIPLYIPPLRERPEDVKALLYAFLEQYNREFRGEKAIAAEAMPYLLRYGYPGNVRELKNLVARMVLTASGAEIGVQDLPDYVRQPREGAPGSNEPRAADAAVKPPGPASRPEEGGSLRERLEAVERQVLAEEARSCRSTYELAEKIGVHQSTVVRKLRKYGIPLGNGR